MADTVLSQLSSSVNSSHLFHILLALYFVRQVLKYSFIVLRADDNGQGAGSSLSSTTRLYNSTDLILSSIFVFFGQDCQAKPHHGAQCGRCKRAVLSVSVLSRFRKKAAWDRFGT